jgi:hypothetical protein
MERRKRRRFTAEYKAEAVKRLEESGQALRSPRSSVLPPAPEPPACEGFASMQEEADKVTAGRTWPAVRRMLGQACRHGIPFAAPHGLACSDGSQAGRLVGFSAVAKEA